MRIAIEGNIGCGKSTVIEAIERMPLCVDRGYATIQEPIDEWQHWLHEMYSDPQRWSFFFNLKVLLTLSSWSTPTRLHSAVDGHDDLRIRQKFLCERSPAACRHVFVPIQSELGDLSAKETELLYEAHAALGWEPDVVVYLRSDPLEAFERMRTRARASEANVGIDYIRAVHEKYERLYNSAGVDKSTTTRNQVVVVVDVGERTAAEVANIVHEKVVAIVGR